MTRYEPKVYENLDEETISAELGKQGYTPQRIREPAGAIYDPHKNPTDLLLAYIKGSADVKVGDQEFHCTAGDRLYISGDVEHSAKVGSEGVVYLMTALEAIGD